MNHPPSVLLRRVGPTLLVTAIVEAALYVLLYRSDTLHDLFRTPALIVAVVGLLVTALHLRGRRHGDRRHASTRRHEERRDAEPARPADEPLVGPAGERR